MQRRVVLALLAGLVFLLLKPGPLIANMSPSSTVFGWIWPPEFPEPPMVKWEPRSIATMAGLLGAGLPLDNPWLLIEKSSFRLSLYSGDKLIKAYPVSFGFSPYGDKVREGDGKTPEGEFYICQKATDRQYRSKFLGTRWMRLSYPNVEHAARGLTSRLVTRQQHDRIVGAIENRLTPLQTTRLGGGIGIHGGTFNYEGVMVRTWTLGCIGMYDSDVEDLYRYVPVGTTVRIVP